MPMPRSIDEAGRHRRRGLRRVVGGRAARRRRRGDPRAVGLHEAAHRLDGRAQDGVEIRRRVERVGDLADRAGPALAAPPRPARARGPVRRRRESCSATASTSVTPVDSGRARSPRSTARAMPTSAPTAFAIRRPKMKARRPAMAAASGRAGEHLPDDARASGPSTASTGAVRTTRQPENGAVAKATYTSVPSSRRLRSQPSSSGRGIRDAPAHHLRLAPASGR